MRLPKQYLDHLTLEWRVVGAHVQNEGGESVLCLSFARGADSVIYDRINLDRDMERFAEFEASIGDYGDWDGLLDRRIGILFDRHRAIVGYARSFHPLTADWPTDWPY